MFIFLFSAQYGEYNKQGNQPEIMNLIYTFLYWYAISHGALLLCGHALCMRSVRSGISGH